MVEFFVFLAFQSAGDANGGIFTLIPFVAIFLIMYFLLIRPQAKERKRIEEELQQLRSSLKSGDKVVTSGGIFGTVSAVREDTVQLRIADAVKIEVLRSAIASKQSDPNQPSEAKS